MNFCELHLNKKSEILHQPHLQWKDSREELWAPLTHKLDSLVEWVGSLFLLKLTWGELNCLKGHLTIKQRESIISHLPK